MPADPSLLRELAAMELSRVVHIIDHDEDGTISQWYRVEVMDESLDGPIMTIHYTVKYDSLTWFLTSMGWSTDPDYIQTQHQGHGH
jgi:hypothetical protein